MTKIEQPKEFQARPTKPVSRLAEIAITQPTRVVSAGEAFERDLAGANARIEQRWITISPVPMPSTPEPKKPLLAPKDSVKRTFRYPRSVDNDLKEFVHGYNYQNKQESEPDLRMEEVGVLMARHFLVSDPVKLTKQFRGL